MRGGSEVVLRLCAVAGGVWREGGARWGCWSVLPLCAIEKSVSPPQADAVGGLPSERGEVAEFILWRLFSISVSALNSVNILWTGCWSLRVISRPPTWRSSAWCTQGGWPARTSSSSWVSLFFHDLLLLSTEPTALTWLCRPLQTPSYHGPPSDNYPTLDSTPNYYYLPSKTHP